MLNWIPAKLFMSKSARDSRSLRRFVSDVTEREKRFENFTIEDCHHQTSVWRSEVQALGPDRLNALDAHLKLIAADAFALVRQASRLLAARDSQWKLIPFDVQIAGGNVLFQGNIAEMATGEGKTLTAVAPAYLRALAGRGVHMVTVNDYLAARDADWMGKMFATLGLTTGCLQNDQSPEQRRAMYACDITYGTSSEFGFDYLRDNGLARSAGMQVQRGHYFAIVDEVDSVLIDEARTPMIITTAGSARPSFLPVYVSSVARLVKEQTTHCNQLIQEARDLFGDGTHRDTDAAVGMLLYKCRLAQPLHPGLRRLKQDPTLLRLLENATLYFHIDSRRSELFAMKDELLFWIDERSHDAELTDRGCRFMSPDCPELFQVGDLMSALAGIDHLDATPEIKQQRRDRLEADAEEHGRRIHEVRQLLKAFCLYEKDRNYLVKDGDVVILDEAQGREMPGRRWNDGLHQAVEAKEGVTIQPESETMASITVQNYFRLYDHLAGMTGTAMSDAGELKDIYGLDVIQVPTHRPCQRVDLQDQVFKTRKEKYQAAVREIKAAHGRSQPVLVGTASVEASETFSRLLKRENIPHQVLNARHHDREAAIIARAGEPGAVTISTNMAGRGTDIQLSGGVADLGGLIVIGTERHESQRVDRQLRGRCARQGDPGTSVFFLSLEDHLMRRIDNGGKMAAILDKAGHVEGEPLASPMLTRTLSGAQKRVEKTDYEQRRRTLRYDEVVNGQRSCIYDWRNELLQAAHPQDWLFEALPDCLSSVVNIELLDDGSGSSTLTFAPEVEYFALPLRDELEALAQERDPRPVHARLEDAIVCHVREAVATIDSELVSPGEFLRQAALTKIDREWQAHLVELEALRERIGFQALAQKDPLVEFTREASFVFRDRLDCIRRGIIAAAREGLVAASRAEARILAERLRPAESEIRLNFDVRPRDLQPSGRNAVCPCGSGRKFKKCCGVRA